MSGNKRTRSKSVEISNDQRREYNAEGEKMDEIVPGNERKQKAKYVKGKKGNSQDKSMAKKKRKTESGNQSNTTVRFVEDDNVVEMEADGQSTEYELDEANNVTLNSMENGDDDNEEDGEIFFSNSQGSQKNNNATRREEPLEEGECSQASAKGTVLESRKELGTVDSMAKLLNQSLNQSMTKMQNYFEQRFAGLERAVEKDRMDRASVVTEARDPVARGNPRNSQVDLEPQRKQQNTAKDAGNSDNQSEITIYKCAVARDITGRRSGSSEEGGMTSDEQMDDSGDSINNEIEIVSDKQQGLSPSSQVPELEHRKIDEPRQKRQPTPAERRGAEMVREAENAKARIYEVAGNENFAHQYTDHNDLLNNQRVHAMIIDEGYKTVASHVEESLRIRIISQEYIDFSKLLPRDRMEDDGKLVWVHRGGETYLVPAAEQNREGSGGINSFHRWEQAFRVYSDIYLDRFPNKAGELIQYGHVIHTASLSYAWENVYKYDREFRTHLSKNPDRSWSVTLQQAWNMYVKDRGQGSGTVNRGGYSEQNANRNQNYGGHKKKVCYGFNTGKCPVRHEM